MFVRYCDGASFAGDSQHEDGNVTLFFRGRRIWEAVLEELMEKGLAHAEQASRRSMHLCSSFYYVFLVIKLMRSCELDN